MREEALRSGIHNKSVLRVILASHGLDTSQVRQVCSFLERGMPVEGGGKSACAGRPSDRRHPAHLRDATDLPDCWLLMPNGDRICSHCRSIDAIGFLAVCRAAADLRTDVWIDGVPRARTVLPAIRRCARRGWPSSWCRVEGTALGMEKLAEGHRGSAAMGESVSSAAEPRHALL